MNLLDLLLAVVVGLSMAAGFTSGFARVGIGFFAAIAGLIFGFWFYYIPAGWVHKYLSSDAACNLIGFFIVFWGFMVLGALIGKIISKLFKWTGFSWFDRLLGGVFGFARGAFMSVIFVAVLLAFTPKPLPNWMVDSQVLPYAIDASNICATLAPRALRNAFDDGVYEIRRAWEEQVRKGLRKKKPVPDLKKIDN